MSGAVAAGASARTLLVVPYPPFRDGLRALLGAADDIEVVGAVASRRDLPDVLSRVRPDLIVTVVDAPHDHAAAGEIAALHEVAPVIVLSPFETREQVATMLVSGALGCVSARSPSEGLIDAIRTVRAGSRYLCPAVAELLVHSRSASAGPRAPTEPALTAREREVLGLVVEGRSNREVGARLGVSVKTVHAHRANVMRKLGVRNASQLTREAVRLGLVP